MRITQLRQADLNLLVVFAVFAEERNVSRAAERLLVSQPAISRALQRLRDMFHDDLFVRTAVGYELTPQGQRLLQELEVMLPKLDRLLSGSSFDPSVEPASFRLAVTDNAAAVLVPVLCREVLPIAKKVRFDFVAWHKGSFDEVTHGSVDLAFSADFDATEEFLDDFFSDHKLLGLAFCQAPRLLAADGSDGAFQAAHAGFARVVTNHVAQSFVGEFDLLGRDAVLFHLTGN